MPASDKVNLEDYADRKIIALAADRMGIGQMSVGPKGEKRNLSVLGQGGRGFMNIFNGGGWAFSDFKTADKFLKRLRAEADPDGNVIVGITVQSPINHLKNQTGQLAYIEAMQAAIDSKTITKRAADAQVAAMSSSIVQSTAKSIKQSARDKFAEIKSFKDLKKAVTNKQINFADMEPMLTQMQRKALPITNKELSDIGMTAADIARDIADPELADVPFGSVVALLGVNVKQAPEKTGIHYSYPWTIHGDAIGYLNKFYNISDLSTEKRIRNAQGVVTAQPLQTVMPVMDNIINTIKTKQGIPSDPSMRYMPSDTDYLSAVEKGDIQAAQRMVDEAAKAAGYTVGPVFHGTRNKFSKFSKGDIGFHFALSKDQVVGPEGRFSESDPTSINLIRGFLNVTKPLRLTDTGRWSGKSVTDEINSKIGSSLNRESTYQEIKNSIKSAGFDGVSYENRFEGPDGSEAIIAFEPSQIKSAEPITKDDAGNVIPLSQRFKATSEDIRFMPDYSGEHRAPRRDSGAPMDNLKDVYPDDVYGPNAARYYGHESGSQTDKAAVRIIQATKGKPDALVKVFRAIPKSIQLNEINPGDWITTIKSYAVQHGEGPLGGDYKILEKTVPAGDLYTDGNSIFEFGYDPKFMPQPDSAMPGAYSFPGGYRAIPGKTKGSLRLYGPAGSLIGIASSLDEAQRILRRKAKQ